MTKAAANYVLCFLAGLLVALGGVVLVEQGPQLWIALPPIDVSGLGDWIGMVDPAPLLIAALGVLAAALVSVYGRDALAPVGRKLHLTAPRARETPVSSGRPAATRGEVTAIRDDLEKQLERLIVLIAGQLENSKDHVASLKDTSAHLASVTSVAELRDVVRSLIAKNEANERQTRQLEERLQEAQDQASNLRQRLGQAEKLASLDPLTSLANRRRFEQFIAAEVERSHRNGTPLCLIMTDIDHFKRVNDSHGHSVGDRVLQAFAELLSKNVRGADLVARFGGEEFAIVLPQTPMGDAFGIAEQIRHNFERHGGRDGSASRRLGRLTASFGVAEIREGEPPSGLIQRADQMLYEAKKGGRNRTMIWSSSAAAAGDGTA